ncbi:hypothetical protein FB45DRAFT_29111 [Roridomyces roridus]|uniref:Alpha-ketoglutarate-dependent dioxygenase AlkB-like domain-containing protein n=1 Tax=Roridomyces roridus TaxID=1738132 RepID=A0AAD7CKD5_9AGAR|nr:hypothetical protein FB45DRAFT_29111 [Roridomyces roridus]
MHPPKHLYDREILNDEPFASLFYARALTTLSRTQEKDFTENVVAQLKRVEGGRAAAKCWLEMAFAWRNMDHDCNLKIFVEFLWLLYKEEWSGAAHKYLESQLGSRPDIDTIPSHCSQQTKKTAKSSTRDRSIWDNRSTQETGEPPLKVQRRSHPRLPPLRISKTSLRTVARMSSDISGERQNGAPADVPHQNLAQRVATVAESSRRLPPGLRFSKMKLRVVETSLGDEGENMVLDLPEDCPPIAQASKEFVSWVARPVQPGILSATRINSYTYGWPDERGGFPPVWSTSRQEICETVPHFRRYQGGVYYKDAVAKGYLLSGFGAARDRFEEGGKLIISHGGGGKPQDRTGKERLDAVNQGHGDQSVCALLQNFEQGRPILLLVDDNYEHFPLKLWSKGIYIAVLGFYSIVDVWAEIQNVDGVDVTRILFVFQWIHEQGEPWWITQQPIEDSGQPTIHFKCNTCAAVSPHVYFQAWVCTNPNCVVFGKTPGGGKLHGPLEYKPEFLRLRPERKFPNGFDTTLVLQPGEDAGYVCGFHCEDCGRISSRFEWGKYQCATCEFTLPVDHEVQLASSLRARVSVPGDLASQIYKLDANSRICALPPKKCSKGVCLSFSLPENCGFIHLIRGSGVEADGIFRLYQEQARSGQLTFRRWPMKRHMTKGQQLSNYFSQNTGEEYQYVAGSGETVPFHEAATAVIHAREFIRDRVKSALGKEVPFNEVLSVAYLKSQSMGFHGDDEKGLGPVIAALSLGAPALMYFRETSKHSSSHKHRKELTLLLEHGSVLVMEGECFQKRYQHTVIPFDFRIAATARFIGPENSQVYKRATKARM